MSRNTAIDTEAASPPQITPRIAPSKLARLAARMDRGLHRHLSAIALAISAVGLALRIIAANRTFLNPDEALHYFLIHEPSLLLAYRASLSNAHPPLIYFLLYFARFLGHSELLLRLPLVFAGTAFCWFTFKWTRELFGEPASLFALIVAAFSPTLISLSAEVREYALMLFGMAAALYFLERAFGEKSVRIMWYFSLFLYFAILSHYSAAFFAFALGVYALARFVDSACPRKVIASWAIGQAGALAIYLFLYLTHLSKIRNNLALWSTSFGDTLFRLDQESIFHFTRQNSWNIFLYLFAQRYVAAAMLVAFTASVVFFMVSDFLSARRDRSSRHTGIQLLLPFVAVWAAAIAAIYPYVGSRHTTVLAPFAIAGASCLFAVICRQKLWAVAFVAALLMAISNFYGGRPEPGIPDQRREMMAGALNYLRQSVPEGDLILADMESTLPLAYYYCQTERGFFQTWSRANFGQFNCDGRLLVPLHFWYLRPEGLAAPFQNLVHDNELRPGDRVWIFQTGWGGNLMAKLPAHLPQFRCITPMVFGQSITIVPLTVGPDLAPAPQTQCPN